MSSSIDPGSPTRQWKTVVAQKSIDLGMTSINALPSFIKDTMLATLKQSGKTTFQPSKVDLVLDVRIGKASLTEPVTVFASLESSNVSSGTMMINTDSQKGWYQDSVLVEMWLENTNGDARADLMRIADGPDTVNGSGSVTSSVSISFSGGANVGFFGGTPTGGASASIGISDTNSFSRNLTDFRTINTSDQFRATHEYKMSQSSGGAYDKATDLVPNGENIGFAGAFQAIRLFTPPDLAINNLPLLSQCAWQANHTRDIKDSIMLKIRVTQHSAMVDGTNKFFTIASHASAQTNVYTHTEPVPLGTLAADPGAVKL